MERVKNKKKVVMGEIMKEAGYSPSVCTKPKNLTTTTGWKALLAQVEDKELLQQVYEIALSDDKRSALAAIDMVWRLKDKYPAGKLKLGGYDSSVEHLSD
jgi:hypothetical protein